MPTSMISMHRFRAPVVALALLLAGGCSDLLSDGYDYGSVDVEVVRRNGEPAPGVRVVLYTWSHHMAYGETDGRGRYTFEFVPPGEYGLRAVPEEPFVTFTGFASVARDRIEMEEGGREEVSFTLLKRGPGTVGVRVQGESGEGVADASVSLYAYFGVVRQGRTGPDGVLEFDTVPFGDYGVRIDPPLGYVAPEDERTFVDGLRVDEGSREVVDFAVERCSGTIRARVTDAAGRPAVGVALAVYTFRGIVTVATTDDAGVADFPDVPCAEVGVALQAGRGYTFQSGRGTSFVDGIRIARGSEAEVSFRVAASSGAARGRVRDEAGAGVEGAEVVLYDAQGEISTVRSGSGGAFRFDPAPCGELGVRVRPPAGYVTVGSGVVDGVRVTDGAEPTVELTVRRS